MAKAINQAQMPVQLQKIRYQWVNLAWQAQLGLALMLFSLLMWGFVNKPASVQLATLVADTHRQQQLLLTKPNPEHLPNKLSETEQLAAILANDSQANALIAQFLQLASQQSLPIDKVDYSAQSVPKSKLQTLHIQLHTKGGYVQVRQFINQVLTAQPSLALSEIRFNRDDLSSEQIDAHMVFTLYLQQK